MLSLQCVFSTNDDKNAVMTLPHAKDDLTANDVKNFMDSVIASGVFVVEPQTKISARLIERNTTVLFGG